MADSAQRRIVTPLARLSFPTVIEPRASKLNPDKKQYSAELLIDPENLKNFKLVTDDGMVVVDIRNLCAEIAREEWGSDFDVETKKKVKPADGGLGWPLKDGNAYAAKREADGKNGDAYKGQVYIRTKGSEKVAPVLKTYVPSDRRFQILERGSDMDMIREVFQAGNYVLAELTAKAVETPAKDKFVTFYLNGVLYVKKGERLGTGGSALDDQYVDDLMGGITDFDPTDGLDESIAL